MRRDMPISTEQRLNLYRLARDHWLEAHGTLSAYERDYRKNRLVSEWVRRGTLASAVATALTTATPWPPLTVAAGILTATLSGIEQAYAPGKSSQAFWDYRTQLEGVKKDIVTCVMAMENATDLVSGMEPLNQIAKRLTEGTKIPFDILQSDQESAQRAFNGSVLAGIIGRYEFEPEFDEDGPAVLGFDAPGIVAVSRKPSHS
jgi:hypothetical protein